MVRKIRIGARGSKLALWQANFIKTEIESQFPDIKASIVIIKTEGDRDQASSLSKIGGQGVFTKTIEDALSKNEVDVAVHSLKDLPSNMPDELILAAVPKRGPVQDVFIRKETSSFENLHEGAKIATGSMRRRCQILHLRPDIKIEDLRGNIDTRLRKLETEGFDGIIMARAALERLEIKNTRYETFPISQMIPAVGQGAIGLQIRKSDNRLYDLLTGINHAATFNSVLAERAFLNKLDSGCQFPVGALAFTDGNRISIEGFVGSEDGRVLLKEKISGEFIEPEKTGEELAMSLIKKGALDLLKRA